MNNALYIARIEQKQHTTEDILYLCSNLTLKQSLSIYKHYITKYIEAKDSEAIRQITEALQEAIQKDASGNISSATNTLEAAHQLLPSYEPLRILLIKSLIDNGEASLAKKYTRSPDDQYHRYLMCTFYVLSGEYVNALRLYEELCPFKDYPHLLSVILYNIDLNTTIKLRVQKLINKICQRKNYSMYFKTINQYIRRLYAEKAICYVEDIETYCSASKINFVLLSDILFHSKKYEECYSLIIDNIHKVSNFLPCGLWLLKSAQELNKLQDLYEVIINHDKPNNTCKQIVDSICEILNIPSSRLYRNTRNTDITQIKNIMFCVNASYYLGFKAAFNSLILNNNNSVENLHVYIFIDNTLDYEDVESFVKQNQECKTTIYNIDNICNTKHVKTDYGLATNHKLDRSAYYRIFGLEFLLKKYKLHKLLYLDSDILVLSDLDALFNIRSKHPICGVLEDTNQLMVQKSKSLNNLHTYINSGVLMFNIDNPLFQTCFQKTINTVSEYDKLILHDQCAINIGFKNNIHLLPQRYNFTLHNHHICNNEDIDILHFTGITKPWQPYYHNHEFLSKIWFSFLRGIHNGSSYIQQI